MDVLCRNVDVMWNIVEECGCFVDVMWNIVDVLWRNVDVMWTLHISTFHNLTTSSHLLGRSS